MPLGNELMLLLVTYFFSDMCRVNRKRKITPLVLEMAVLIDTFVHSYHLVFKYIFASLSRHPFIFLSRILT